MRAAVLSQILFATLTLGRVDAADMAAILAAPPNPIDMNVIGDEAGAVTRSIDASGGSIALTTPDGATFTLEFPAGSLSGPTDISLEPVTRIDGLPAPLTRAYAVLMRPDGLVLSEPALLRVKFPAAENGKDIHSLGFDGEGFDTSDVPYIVRDGELLRAVSHFSGAALAPWDHHFQGEKPIDQAAEDAQADAEFEQAMRDSLAAMVARTEERRARAAAERAAAEIEQLLKKERACQLLGGQCDEDAMRKVCDIHNTVGDAFGKATFDALLAPGMDCETASKTLRENLGIERSSQLLGCKGQGDTLSATRPVKVNGATRDLDMMSVVARICDKEAEAMCQKSGAIADLLQTLLAIERQKQLMGSRDKDERDVFERLKSCGAFEVTIGNRYRELADSGGGCTTKIEASVQIKADTAIVAGSMGSELSGEATHKMEDYSVNLRCESGDIYRMINWATQDPPKISVYPEIRSVPDRKDPTRRHAEIIFYNVAVDPGSIVKTMEAKSSGTGWTEFIWAGWFRDAFNGAYGSRMKGGTVVFKVPMTGEVPVVGRAIDQGIGSYTDISGYGSQVQIDSDIAVRHLPPKIRNGDWTLADPK